MPLSLAAPGLLVRRFYASFAVGPGCSRAACISEYLTLEKVSTFIKSIIFARSFQVGFFEELGVDTEPSEMSFSLSVDGGAVEWGSHGLDAVFAQRRNAASPAFLAMLRDVVRFGREAPEVRSGTCSKALGGWVWSRDSVGGGAELFEVAGGPCCAMPCASGGRGQRYEQQCGNVIASVFVAEEACSVARLASQLPTLAHPVCRCCALRASTSAPT